MFRVLPLLLALACSACALQATPEPETVPQPPAVQRQELEALRSELDALKGWLGTLDGRVSTLEPWTARIARLETLTIAPVSTKKGTPKPGRVSNPLTLISQAQQEARVYPTAEGYFGKSGEYTYAWAPGKVTTIYLHPSQCTLISLGPSEQLVVGLLLDNKEYKVETKTVGQGGHAYDATSVCPLIDKGEVPTFMLTKSGRRYLLHLVIVKNPKEAMIAVTFETPAITPVSAPEPRLAFPKPTS